jgi:nucleotide-binding universal stress UspA family protein
MIVEMRLAGPSSLKREGRPTRKLAMSTLIPHKILIPVDGSTHADRAAEYACRYAKEFPACEVVLVYAQPPETFRTHTPDGKEVFVEVAALGKKTSAAARKLLDAQQLAYRLTTELGDPAEVIASTAAGERVDEIVMGSRGVGQWEGLMVGSVTYKVIHRVSLPITVVHAQSPQLNVARRNPQRLLVAVDSSKHALHAVQYVCRLHAASVPVEVELVTVVLPIPEGYVSSFLDQDQIDNYYRKEGESALSVASEVLRSSAIAFRIHVAAGSPADKIVQMAETLECGRIIMGTRGLGSVAHLLLGSVAYRVIHLASPPVTLVR